MPDIVSATDYSSFGVSLLDRQINASNVEYGFNGKWNEIETGYQNYGMRDYDARARRFTSVDPITKHYPQLTPYQFASNDPIAGIDLDGLEFYYSLNGNYLGKGSNDKSTEVRLARLGGKTNSNNNIFVAVDKTGKDASVWTIIHENHSTFLKFASAIHQETGSKDFKEAYSIGSSMVNFTKTPYAVKEGYSLDKMVTTPNTQWYGVSQPAYDAFIKENKNGKGNEKFAISAAVNSLIGGIDYSNGSVLWDGKEVGHGNSNRATFGFKFSNSNMLNKANSLFGSVYQSGVMGKRTFIPFKMEENTYNGGTGVEIQAVYGTEGRIGGSIFYKPIDPKNYSNGEFLHVSSFSSTKIKDTQK